VVGFATIITEFYLENLWSQLLDALRETLDERRSRLNAVRSSELRVRVFLRTAAVGGL